MSAPILLTGTRLGNRYVVKSVASFGTGRPSYFVRDTLDGGVTRVVRETLLSGLDAEDRRARRAMFLEAAEAARGLEHPCLCTVRDVFVEGNRAYVVMDRVEGVTLSALLQMGGHGLREASVLRWGAEIAEALAWLHGLQRPYTFGYLDPADVVVTPRDHVVVMDYGLGRFFAPRPARSALVADASALLDDQVALGNLLETLLCGTVPDVGHALPHLRHATEDVLARLRGRPPYGDLKEAAACMRAALESAQPRVEEPDLPRGVEDPATVPSPVRGDGVLLRALAVTAIAACLLLGWATLAPARRVDGATPRLWIVDGDETVRVVTLDGRAEGKPLRFAGSRLDGLRWVARAGVLVVVDGLRPQLLFVHPETGAPLSCPLDHPSRALLLSPDERTLYCVEGTDTVSQISVAAARRVHAWKVGGRVTHLALSRDGQFLYVSDTHASTVRTIDLYAGAIVGEDKVAGGPGPLLADPDGHVLWVALEDTGRIALLDVRTDGRPGRVSREVAEVSDTVSDLRLTPDERSIYALCGDSHRIAVIDAATRALVQFIDVPAWQPRDWAFSSHPAQAFVVADGTSGIAIIDAEGHRYERGVNLGGRPRAIDFER